jgi:hypothetical protein
MFCVICILIPNTLGSPFEGSFENPKLTCPFLLYFWNYKLF